MLQARVVFFAMITIALVAGCHHPVPLPHGDKDNGGLFFPGGFEAVVVADSIGRGKAYGCK